ncbi:endonuclease III [Candidatus Dependentiae bacterium]|nr:endonuclease III [Candidatus Dependentiae bacterium]
MAVLVNKKYGKDPYLILISCLLSLRARDIVTWPIVQDLFKIAKTPQQMLKIPKKKLEELLYPIGFYKRKAKILHDVSKELIEKFDAQVPPNKKDLLSIKGIGPKTANLVLAEAFDQDELCVDTHVQRLANLFGLVKTKTPEQTESELKKLLPQKYWREVNRLFVTWGQNIPTSKSSLLYLMANNP